MGAPEGFRVPEASRWRRNPERSRDEPVSRLAPSPSGLRFARRADLVRVRTSPHVMVITSEGLFQSYLIDLENGGECSLVKEFP